MTAWAAHMTGKGASAIATILVVGEGALHTVSRVVRPLSGGVFRMQTGQILVGMIREGPRRIDQVVVGCEGPDRLAIHCHGNGLIVGQIMALLQDAGASLVSPERVKAETLRDLSVLGLEVRMTQLHARTLEGVELLAHQATGGLSEEVLQWRGLPLETIRGRAAQVLRDSSAGRRIVHGCTVVLAGPPNSGKSTLFNALAGQDKALVTDVRGTTRDYVEAEVLWPGLCVDLVDTAGLDPRLAGPVDRTAQAKTLEMIRRSDLVLWVVDGSKGHETSDLPGPVVSDRPVLVVLNKADLPGPGAGTGHAGLPCVEVSARERMHLDVLRAAVRRACGVEGFALTAPVAFTSRQVKIMEDLAQVASKDLAHDLIRGLLEGA